ncbi:hypothetical protein N7481_011151 [Penicillium waksmanii]|uniref:uncharacterized protein n=1 Tax=Penicillium waksmanii TaxID=69791 RepID=UPI002547909C|nr:uncharacterized protein N7481_011151 [Penicillium waksmanii]KAJ5973941.1 hypothetical protein N7481_011151 [Penicillium waksmanii]
MPARIGMSSPPRARASRSCGNCRAVKRRCDKQSPQCGQCIRTRETCQGYRDEWDLVFRDQTSHTIKRSKKSPAGNNTISSELTTPPTTTHSHSPRSPPPARGPDPNLDEIGVNYFLQDFVAGGRVPSRGYLNYIPTVYSPDSEHPTLITSMAAVGLIALATRQPELAAHARAKYSEAIRYVNNAIASPTESIKDSTLMSVISLGVFEHVSNFESWVRHVKGAASLVIARGKSQFSSRVSILMFNQVRADMCAACIQSIQPFPDDMCELQDEATKYTEPTDAFWILGILSSRCATLFAGVVAKNNGASLPISWSDFLEESIALQAGFKTAVEILAVHEPYTSIQVSKGSSAFISFRGRYDLYQTAFSIRLWNNSRMVEIIVCEIICWLINKIITSDLDGSGHVSGQDGTELKSKLHYAAHVIAERGGGYPIQHSTGFRAGVCTGTASIFRRAPAGQCLRRVYAGLASLYGWEIACYW